MVGFHVVDDQIVYLTLSDDFMDVFDVLREEVHFYGIDQTYFLVVDKI